jgi:hypothetical protein
MKDVPLSRCVSEDSSSSRYFSALIDLVLFAASGNVLLLGGKISLGSDVSEVSDYYLLHLVQNCLLYGNEKMKVCNCVISAVV